MKCSRSQMAAQWSKAWRVFASSNTGIMGSNPTQGMNVCVRIFCVSFVMCVGSDLAMGWSPVQGVLPNVYRIKKLKRRTRSKKRTVEQYTDGRRTDGWNATDIMSSLTSKKRLIRISRSNNTLKECNVHMTELQATWIFFHFSMTEVLIPVYS
jgi:hypothetical protein